MAVMIREAAAPPKTNNPYWDEAREAIEDRDRLSFDGYIEKHGDAWSLRERFVRRYSWAIPDPASLAFVAQYLGERAIEIGAGTGYWAWQLSQLGVDILAYDTAPPDKEPNGYFAPIGSRHSKRVDRLKRTWYPVKKRGPDVLKKYGDRTLFLCWPPNFEAMSEQCLRLYRGNRFVYIGDSNCCGSLDFADLLRQQWKVVARHDIAQWRHINDSIVVYDRKELLEAPHVS